MSNVLTQMDRVGAPDGSLDLLEGDPPDVIACAAHESDASMIVCGIGRHLEGDRPFREYVFTRTSRSWQPTGPCYGVRTSCASTSTGVTWHPSLAMRTPDAIQSR